MKYTPGEDYKVWLERVRLFELGNAYKRLSQGEDPAKILEDLARNITNRSLYPIFKAIKEPKQS